MGERYPVLLDLEGRPVLVVGGGPVAARKVAGLLRAGARVTVVAPEVCPELRGCIDRAQARWVPRGFEPGDMDGTVLAFVATSDPGVNRAAAGEARARGVWVNAADDPRGSDFHVPAVVRRGRLTVAVATAGASPEAAAWVRDRIAERLPQAVGELVELAGRVREMARRRGAVRRLLEAGVLDDLVRGDRDAVDRKVAAALGAGEGAPDREAP